MIKKRGSRLKQNETKSYILRYILEKNEPLSEPDIRNYLNKKYNLIDQSTINRHLHELREEGCIKLIPPEKKGLRNKWDITKVKQLKEVNKKIKEENGFKEIKLSMYEKPKKVILRESGYGTKYLGGLEYYIYLLLLPSFFDMCIETGIEKLYSMAWEIYISEEGFKQYQTVEKGLKDCYTAYIKRCKKIGMTEETFRIMMETVALTKRRISSEREFIKYWEINYLGISGEGPRQFTKEDLLELSGGKYPTQSKEEFLKLLRKLDQEYPKVEEKDFELYREMYRVMREMRELYLKFQISRFDLLIGHFFHHDRLKGVVSPDELNVMKKIKENHTKARYLYNGTKDSDDIIEELMSENLKEMCKIIVKYKQPSEFSKIYNNPENAYQELKKMLFSLNSLNEFVYREVIFQSKGYLSDWKFL